MEQAIRFVNNVKLGALSVYAEIYGIMLKLLWSKYGISGVGREKERVSLAYDKTFARIELVFSRAANTVNYTVYPSATRIFAFVYFIENELVSKISL